MRIPEVFAAGVLSIVVVGEGAYILKTRKHVDVLEQRIEQLASESPRFADNGPAAAMQGRGGFRVNDDSEGDDPAAGLPPPRFVVPAQALAAAAAAAANPNGDPLPLPPGLDSPEAREQLRQFVVAQLAREREEREQQQQQRREEQQQRQRETMAKNLGLNADETKRFSDLLTAQQNARGEMRDKVQSGQLSREQIAQEFQKVREQSESQMRALLGDDRLKKFQEMQRRPGGQGDGNSPGGAGRFGRGGGGAGFGFGGGNQPGGGPGATANAIPGQ